MTNTAEETQRKIECSRKKRGRGEQRVYCKKRDKV
jgi:hypothetical protein